MKPTSELVKQLRQDTGLFLEEARLCIQAADTYEEAVEYAQRLGRGLTTQALLGIRLDNLEAQIEELRSCVKP